MSYRQHIGDAISSVAPQAFAGLAPDTNDDPAVTWFFVSNPGRELGYNGAKLHRRCLVQIDVTGTNPAAVTAQADAIETLHGTRTEHIRLIEMRQRREIFDAADCMVGEQIDILFITEE